MVTGLPPKKLRRTTTMRKNRWNKYFCFRIRDRGRQQCGKIGKLNTFVSGKVIQDDDDEEKWVD